MLGELHCKGFQAIVLGHCATRDGLLYLRLLAPPTADKAIWAALNSSKARRGNFIEDVTLTLPGAEYTRSVNLARGTRYLSPRAALPCGYTDLAFLHPDITTSAGEIFYLLAGDDADGPPPAFFPMLNARLALPLLPAWADWLWEEGLKGYTPPDASWRTPKLIDTMHANGVGVYKVRADAETTPLWLAVLRRGLGFDLAEWEVLEEAA